MMLKKLWSSLCFRLSGLIGPRMISGFRRHDGLRLPRTRVSNMSRIEHPGRLRIADNVFIGHFNFIDASGGLQIDEGCQITNYVSILTHSSHIAIRLYGRHYLEHTQHIGYLRKPGQIGAYSFIGPHSVLMPGVSLGKGSLIAAYSFVQAGEYPEFSVLSGNPAKVVGDTRDMDAQWLATEPALATWYQEWAGEHNH